jgi:hypothetical protein
VVVIVDIMDVLSLVEEDEQHVQDLMEFVVEWNLLMVLYYVQLPIQLK